MNSPFSLVPTLSVNRIAANVRKLITIRTQKIRASCLLLRFEGVKVWSGNHSLRRFGPLLLVAIVSWLPHTPLYAADKAVSPADEKLQQELHAALKSGNPNYENGGSFQIRDGKLVSIVLMRQKGLHDLSPLSRFSLSSVAAVNLYNSTDVTNLSPLRGCKVTSLNLERCVRITDLSPLAGMPIRFARIYACAGLSDLGPLKDMPLRHLDFGLNPNIADLSPLKGMPLHDLRMDNCPRIQNIAIIRGMPIKFLSLFGCIGIKDYSPLEDLKLETIYFSPALLSKDEIQILRRMKSLKKIGTSWADYRKEPGPAEFWKRYDAGEFRKTIKRP